MPHTLWFTYLLCISEIMSMERIHRIEDLHSKDPAVLHRRLRKAVADTIADRSTSEANLRMLAAGDFGDAIRIVEKFE